ncbi:MAG: hypothetical protein Rhob2KO_53030 [Rhodopirellula baltica]
MTQSLNPAIAFVMSATNSTELYGLGYLGSIVGRYSDIMFVAEFP